MEFDNIVKLIQTVSESNLTGFIYEESGLTINMKTDKESNVITTVQPVTGAPVYVAGNVAAQEAPAPAGTATAEALTGKKVVKSPLVGTFYVSNSPEAEPLVQVGDTVKKGQILGIVEAMKLMNEIESEFDGVVKEILVSNEDVIEYGQPMFVIE